MWLSRQQAQSLECDSQHHSIAEGGVQAGQAEIQGHPQLPSKLEASQSYTRSFLVKLEKSSGVKRNGNVLLRRDI